MVVARGEVHCVGAERCLGGRRCRTDGDERLALVEAAECSEERLEGLQRELEAESAALRSLAGRLSQGRAKAATRLGTAVTTELSELNMADAEFRIPLVSAGDDLERRAEIEVWLPHLPPTTPIWVSHLAPEVFHAVAADHPERPFRIRVGTALWHGIPRGEFVHLGAEVVQTRPARAGDLAGYHRSRVPFDGTLVSIGAGVAAGIALLQSDDPARRSPFHFARTRLHLLEPPHMHTSIAVVPTGAPCPVMGDLVDVQRPLLATTPDELVWL